MLSAKRTSGHGVMPSRSRMTASIRLRFFGSSAEVNPSNSYLGLWPQNGLQATRCCWPPDAGLELRASSNSRGFAAGVPRIMLTAMLSTVRCGRG